MDVVIELFFVWANFPPLFSLPFGRCLFSRFSRRSLFPEQGAREGEREMQRTKRKKSWGQNHRAKKGFTLCLPTVPAKITPQINLLCERQVVCTERRTFRVYSLGPIREKEPTPSLWACPLTLCVNALALWVQAGFCPKLFSLRTHISVRQRRRENVNIYYMEPRGWSCMIEVREA